MTDNQIKFVTPKNLLMFCVLLAGSVATSIGYLQNGLTKTMNDKTMKKTNLAPFVQTTEKKSTGKIISMVGKNELVARKSARR